MAAGVVTGDIWQRVNQSIITGGGQPTSTARGTVGGQRPCIPSSYSLSTSCLLYHLFSDLGGCWSSKQREIWAYDRVVFTSPSFFLLWYSQSGITLHHLHPSSSQGHLWLTDFSWLYNVMRPSTSISSFFRITEPTKQQSSGLIWPGMKCSVKCVHLNELLNIHLRHPS